jgi:predicted nuclease of predicted toxin-antitoxin system
VKRLLIDENLPVSLATLLPLDCCHATELGQQPTDSLLWNHAREPSSTEE